jgi:hypothetical protein
MIPVRWFFSYEASSEISIFPRKWPPYYMKTTTPVPQQQMRRNQLHALAIWTSNTFLLVNGLNVILWCWNRLIPPSTFWITLPRVFNQISFINIPILSLVTFLWHIHQYIVQLLGDMSQMMNMLRSLFLAHSLPHSLPQQLAFMLQFHAITLEILGLPFLGMGFPIHLFPCLAV